MKEKEGTNEETYESAGHIQWPELSIAHTNNVSFSELAKAWYGVVSSCHLVFELAKAWLRFAIL
jgi:hypothetical protein